MNFRGSFLLIFLQFRGMVQKYVLNNTVFFSFSPVSFIDSTAYMVTEVSTEACNLCASIFGMA